MRDNGKRNFYPGAMTWHLANACRCLPREDDEGNDEEMMLLMSRANSLLADVMELAGFSGEEIYRKLKEIEDGKDGART